MRIVRETGQSVAQVARDLGVNEGTLGNWVRRDQAERAGGLTADERRAASPTSSASSARPWRFHGAS